MEAGGIGPGDGTHAGAPSALVLRHAAKSFDAVQALIDGSVTLRRGEVHALLGENGAVMSTFVKTLAGVHQPVAPHGQPVAPHGQPVAPHGPAVARAAGIAAACQEPTLFPDLTVAENMFIGRQALEQYKLRNPADPSYLGRTRRGRTGLGQGRRHVGPVLHGRQARQLHRSARTAPSCSARRSSSTHPTSPRSTSSPHSSPIIPNECGLLVPMSVTQAGDPAWHGRPPRCL